MASMRALLHFWGKAACNFDLLCLRGWAAYWLAAPSEAFSSPCLFLLMFQRPYGIVPASGAYPQLKPLVLPQFVAAVSLPASALLDRTDYCTGLGDC